MVRRLRDAGGWVMGKTVTTELATYAPGKTRNPHHAGHTPGGSSSGSAAAVAAGMVPLAIGTQTNGSVIRPASFCGVFGFKPSAGLIPRTGVLTQSPRVRRGRRLRPHAGRRGAAGARRWPATTRRTRRPGRGARRRWCAWRPPRRRCRRRWAGWPRRSGTVSHPTRRPPSANWLALLDRPHDAARIARLRGRRRRLAPHGHGGRHRGFLRAGIRARPRPALGVAARADRARPPGQRGGLPQGAGTRAGAAGRLREPSSTATTPCSPRPRWAPRRPASNPPATR